MGNFDILSVLFISMIRIVVFLPIDAISWNSFLGVGDRVYYVALLVLELTV